MKISIAQRYRPFSRENGSECLLPGTCTVVQAFPSIIYLRDRKTQNSKSIIEIPLRLHGPVQEFTLEMDLEKGCVNIRGVAKEGRFYLCLQVKDGVIQLKAIKMPSQGMRCQDRILHAGESISLGKVECVRPIHLERLSLGCHRKQDWTMVQRRLNPLEILPILFHLSQWTPIIDFPQTKMLDLFDEGIDLFLRAAFSGILSPRLIDDEYQGILENNKVSAEASPCALITSAGKKIRNLFIEQKDNRITLLPKNSFDCGRMTVVLQNIGTIDFEWRKGAPRRAVLHAHHDATVQFSGSMRVRLNTSDRGKRASDGRVDVRANTKYLLDRFQK